jgi:hypothetical protein
MAHALPVSQTNGKGGPTNHMLVVMDKDGQIPLWLHHCSTDAMCKSFITMTRILHLGDLSKVMIKELLPETLGTIGNIF